MSTTDDPAIHTCVACGHRHGPTNEWIVCLSAEVARQRRVILAMKKLGEKLTKGTGQ